MGGTNVALFFVDLVDLRIASDNKRSYTTCYDIQLLHWPLEYQNFLKLLVWRIASAGVEVTQGGCAMRKREACCRSRCRLNFTSLPWRNFVSLNSSFLPPDWLPCVSVPRIMGRIPFNRLSVKWTQIGVWLSWPKLTFGCYCRMVPLNSRWSRVTDHSVSLYTLHTSPALSQSLSSLSTNTRAHKNLSTLDKSLQQKTISKPVKHLLHMFLYVISPPQKSQAESKTSLQLFRAHRKFPNLTASTSVRDFLFHRRTSLLTPHTLSGTLTPPQRLCNSIDQWQPCLHLP